MKYERASARRRVRIAMSENRVVPPIYRRRVDDPMKLDCTNAATTLQAFIHSPDQSAHWSQTHTPSNNAGP